MIAAAVAILLPLAAAFAGLFVGPSPTRSPRGGPSSTRPVRGGTGRGSGEAGSGTAEGAAGRRDHAVVPGPWRVAAIIAVAPVAISTLLTLVVAVSLWADPAARAGTLTVVPTGTVSFGIGLYVDGLSAVVAFMVCCVALAVQIYSVSAMAPDPRYSGYAAFVSLCTAAMLLVVLSGDLIVLYVGWEVMGLCSYILIGHRWEDRATSRAAVKTFLMTGLGDAGFLLGILVLGLGAHTFSIRGVAAYDYPHATVLAGTLLLLGGVAGKSAQFPLHTWLPTAIVAPTPVSALIHGATMAAAGGYVVARLFPAFRQAPGALAVLGVMAAVSMLGAALAALVQNDLRLVLAYSTISQVGYMAAGLAVGARDAAIFHLIAHGLAKAVLFLAAGCVISVVGSSMLPYMGGLRLAMPVTFWSATIGWAVLAGVPVASGFFSENAIIAAAQHAVFGRAEHRPGVLPVGIPVWTAVTVYVALLLTFAVTGAYATRAWLMTFCGERRRVAGRFPARLPAREAPSLMRLPVAALAVPALVLGFFGLGSSELRPEVTSTFAALLMVVAGAGTAFVVWNRDPALDPARTLGPVRTLLERARHVDDLYDLVIVRPVRALARLVVIVDDRVVGAAVVGIGRGVQRLGGGLRGTAGGNPQTYLTGLLAGVAVIALVVVVVYT